MCPECVRTLTAELKWYRREFGTMAEEVQMVEIPGGEVISEERMQEAIAQHEVYAETQQAEAAHDSDEGTSSQFHHTHQTDQSNAESGDQDLAQQALSTRQTEASDDDIQQLLDADDADLAALTLENLEDELDIAFISTLDPEKIRKYGFKRLKYK
jgi:hypothetical protein